jgi:hypothetical protein
MAVDWGSEERPKLSQAALRRVFSYFLPYRRRSVLVVACIVAQAVLGLAPANDEPGCGPDRDCC